MLKAIINVSLDEKLGAHMPVDRRFAMVMATMRLCFREAIGEIQLARYTGPDGETQEHCAVVTISCDVPRCRLEDGLFNISRSLGQDCVAVMWPDGSGACIGPRAARWPFDAKFFRLPLAMQVEAA